MLDRPSASIEVRTLALRRIAVDRMCADSRLLIVRDLVWLTGWRSAASSPYLDDRDRLMLLGVDACLSATLDDSQRAAAPKIVAACRRPDRVRALVGPQGLRFASAAACLTRINASISGSLIAARSVSSSARSALRSA